MFTGITQGCCTVIKVNIKNDLIDYWIELPHTALKGLEVGASIAIDGVCQTVRQIDTDSIMLSAGKETLAITTLASLTVGQKRHFERSMCVGDEIGGHIVSGHVHDTCTLQDKQALEGNLLMTVRYAPKHALYLLPKGFVALDGCSLTINDVNAEKNQFTINLYPHTIEVTHFDIKEVGDSFNLEIDPWTRTLVDTVRKRELLAHK